MTKVVVAKFLVAIFFIYVLTGPARAGTPTAVFGFEIYDTSGEGRSAAQDRRLEMAGAVLREELAAADRYDVVPLGPYADEVDALGYLEGCNGCELKLARKAGARWSVRGLVHKVSSLILYLRITVTDAHSGDVIRSATAGIRGDNDRAWRRGIRYLVAHELAGSR